MTYRIGRVSGVFISYRRDDEAGWVRAVHDRLSSEYGDEAVFIDVDDIPPGDDFTAAITQQLRAIDAVVVVIGPRWVNATGADGNPRLHDPEDLVRREIAIALSVGVYVIPVLVAGASMPTPDQLPEDLQPLAGINALELLPARFDADVGTLVDLVGTRVGSSGDGVRRPQATETPSVTPALRDRTTSPAEAAPALGRWSRLWGRAKVPIEVLSAVVLIVTILTAAWNFLYDPPPDPIPGDLTIGVAEFATEAPVTVEAANEAKVLPREIATVLESALPCNSVEAPDDRLLGCRGPDQIPAYGDADSAKAGRYAEAIQADLFIYGTVTSTDDFDAIVQPVLLISTRNLPRAEELAGIHALEPIAGGSATDAAKKRLRGKIADQANALAGLARALDFYADGDHEAALTEVESLIESGSHALINEPLVHVLAGNLYGNVNEPAEAEAAYRRSLGPSQGYARGWLGLAEVSYQQAIGGRTGGCDPGTVDPVLLDTTIERATKAEATAVPHEQPAIGAKAAYIRGRALLCSAASGDAQELTAINELLQSVVDAHNAEVAGIRVYASESASLLGESARLEALEKEDREGTLQAAVMFKETAIDLATDPVRKVVFLLDQSRLYGALKKPVEGCSSLARAQTRLDLSPQIDLEVATALSGALKDERSQLDCPTQS